MVSLLFCIPSLAAAQLFTRGNQFLTPAASATFGAGTAVADGDFNGDGFTDLAVGEPNAAGGGGADAGRVQVWFGSAAGLQLPIVLQQGLDGLPGEAEPGDIFGVTLAAGDFDHDGFDDLAIGVVFEDIVVGAGGFRDAGAIEVVYGSSTGLDTSRAHIFNQASAGVPGLPQSFAVFGYGLVAGDFNGDDFADLAAGATGEDIGIELDAGKVYLFPGSTLGLTASGSVALDKSDAGGTASAGDQFGKVLAAGDFDADGIADLAIGDPDETVNGASGAGAVWILEGTGAGIALPGTRLFQGRVLPSGTLPGVAEAGDNFGASLAIADFDRTNAQSPRYQDLAIGVPHENDPAGAVEILAGSANGITAAGSFLFAESDLSGAAATPANFGTSLAAGPLHSLVRGDLIVGVPYDPAGGEAGAGRVFVIPGSANGLRLDLAGEWDATRAGLACGPPTLDEGFGFALALGNFDGNEVRDLAIGVPGFDAQGFRNFRGGVEVLYSALFASDFETHDLTQWSSSAP